MLDTKALYILPNPVLMIFHINPETQKQSTTIPFLFLELKYPGMNTLGLNIG